MKTNLYKVITIALSLMSAMPVLASDPTSDIQKEKTISKVYLVNPDAETDIKNKYGSIYVTTWNEDKVGIDIVIRVHGKDEAKVNKRLDAITIDFTPLKHLVSATTVIGNVSGGNIGMEINYTIKIPKNGRITLNNQYGPIILDKINGKASIDCKYGNVTATELQSDSNDISIQYCDKSSIGYIKNGIIDAKYSGLAISKAGNLTYKSDYTNLALKEVTSITYKSNYGGLTIASASNIDGNGDYLDLKFGAIGKNLNIDSDYSNISVGNITAKANNIAIRSAYTNIDMKYDSDYAFDFEFTMKYAGLQAAGLLFQTKKETNTSAYYKGYYKSSGANHMSVSSNYGNLKLTKI